MRGDAARRHVFESDGYSESNERRDDEPKRARDVYARLVEERAHGQLCERDADEYHRYRRGHRAERARYRAEFLATVYHKKVDFGNEKHDDGDGGRDNGRIEQDLFRADVVRVVRYKIYAERPCEHGEHEVEHHHVQYGDGVAVGEHLDERNAQETAVGEHRDKGIHVGGGSVLIPDEHRFAQREHREYGNGRHRRGDAEIGEQSDAIVGSYRFVVRVGKYGERRNYERGLAHVQQDIAERGLCAVAEHVQLFEDEPRHGKQHERREYDEGF